MTTKHTPGPWRAMESTKADYGVVIAPDGAVIATVESDHDARHIVACVNACEGINPEAVPDLLIELADAVELLGYHAPDTFDDAEHEAAWKASMDRKRAAIAKAKVE